MQKKAKYGAKYGDRSSCHRVLDRFERIGEMRFRGQGFRCGEGAKGLNLETRRRKAGRTHAEAQRRRGAAMRRKGRDFQIRPLPSCRASPGKGNEARGNRSRPRLHTPLRLCVKKSSLSEFGDRRSCYRIPISQYRHCEPKAKQPRGHKCGVCRFWVASSASPPRNDDLVCDLNTVTGVPVTVFIVRRR